MRRCDAEIDRIRAEHEAALRRAPTTHALFAEVNHILYSEVAWHLSPAAVRELETLELVLGQMKARGQEIEPDSAAHVRTRLDAATNDNPAAAAAAQPMNTGDQR